MRTRRIFLTSWAKTASPIAATHRNCVRVCPMSIPLTKAVYEENRETILHGLFGWLKR